MTTTAGPVQAGGQTRVTLVGRRRRVDVVVPSSEPVGRLLPEALRLVGEAPGDQALLRHLATLDGQLLHPDSTLGAAGVADGAVLRVVGLAEAPPPPVVLDVTEEVAADEAHRGGRWGPRARWRTATAVAVAAAVLAARLAVPELAFHTREVAPAGAALVTLLVGGVLARWASRTVGTTLLLVAAALGTDAALTLTDGWLATTGAVGLVACVTVGALALTAGWGRGAAAGAAVGLLLLLAWVVAVRSLPLGEAAAVLAVASAVLVGVLPRLALVSAGLTSLDDRRASGAPVPRPAVALALSAAHRALLLTTVATAVSAAVAGVLLADGGRGWEVAVAALLLVVLCARARAFPLVAEVVALVAAAAIVAAALLLARLRAEPQEWTAAVVGLAVLALVAAVLPAVQVPEHVRARLRGVADRLDLVATVCLLPVLVGVFGVYGRLLESF